jgi:hypothetical protein
VTKEQNDGQLPADPLTTSHRRSIFIKRPCNALEGTGKFYIPLFEGLIDVNVVDKWLNLLEGYFSVHNFFDREKITFSLLKVVPHVKDWWDTYSEQRVVEESRMFVVAPTWDSFWDAIKEQYYPVGSYKDQYTRWTTLHRERDQTIPYFTNSFYTIHT